MVARSTILLALTLWAAAAVAQNYSSSDTVTEYPNKGTFYHDKFEGRKTASGEVFDQNKFTAAHWRIKIGTYILVTNQNTGLQVIVRVNDRCPKRGVIDMTRRAAYAIGIRGCQPVTVRVLPDGYEERWAAQETQFDSVHSRFAPSVVSVVPPLVPRTQVQPAKGSQVPIYADDMTADGGYCLRLAIVANHTEAYELIALLPDEYRKQVLVEQAEPDDSITVTLDLRLNRTHADALRKALLPLFPHAEVRAR